MELRRVQLASPGSNLRMLERGSQSNADHVFLDLEDSVAPNQKVEARQVVVKALKDFDWSGKIACVRVNGIDTEWFYGDVIEVVEGAGRHLDTIMLPKANKPHDVYMLDMLLTQIEMHRGLELGGIGIEAQIEMAEGMMNVNQVAFASPRLKSLIFGPGDYSASVQARGLSIGATEKLPRPRLALRHSPHRRSRPRRRLAGHRRTLRRLPQSRGLPPVLRDGPGPRLRRQVGHPPGPDRRGHRRLLAL